MKPKHSSTGGEARQEHFQELERRLDDLRDEARRTGAVSGAGVHPAGGPMPLQTPETLLGKGYYGLPILKPPVWEWMISAYFFIGGLAGMAALIATGALIKGNFEMARVAMWAAGIGAILSPILLTWDLGRPMRFIYMLRVFKYQSPMSVGSWIVSGFGAASIPGLALTEWHWQNLAHGTVIPAVHILAILAIVSSGFAGIFLATYTGALIAVTAVPAWNLHRAVLPFHFGMAGLGSAVALLKLTGFDDPALAAIFLFAAGAETWVLLWLELRKHGAADHALHHGKSGWILRLGESFEGPVALILAVAHWPLIAAGCFLVGALVTRFGWVSAGRASPCNPDSVLASQTGPTPPARARKPFNLEPAVASTGSLRKE